MPRWYESLKKKGDAWWFLYIQKYSDSWLTCSVCNNAVFWINQKSREHYFHIELSRWKASPWPQSEGKTYPLVGVGKGHQSVHVGLPEELQAGMFIRSPWQPFPEVILIIREYPCSALLHKATAAVGMSAVVILLANAIDKLFHVLIVVRCHSHWCRKEHQGQQHKLDFFGCPSGRTIKVFQAKHLRKRRTFKFNKPWKNLRGTLSMGKSRAGISIGACFIQTYQTVSQALRYHGQSFHNTSKKTRGVLGLEQKKHWLSRSGLKEKLLCQASWVVSVVWPPSNPKNQNLPWSWFYSCIFFQVETNPFQEVSMEISRETGRKIRPLQQKPWHQPQKTRNNEISPSYMKETDEQSQQ